MSDNFIVRELEAVQSSVQEQLKSLDYSNRHFSKQRKASTMKVMSSVMGTHADAAAGVPLVRAYFRFTLYSLEILENFSRSKASCSNTCRIGAVELYLLHSVSLLLTFVSCIIYIP